MGHRSPSRDGHGSSSLSPDGNRGLPESWPGLLLQTCWMPARGTCEGPGPPQGPHRWPQALREGLTTCHLSPQSWRRARCELLDCSRSSTCYVLGVDSDPLAVTYPCPPCPPPAPRAPSPSPVGTVHKAWDLSEPGSGRLHTASSLSPPVHVLLPQGRGSPRPTGHP